MIKRAKEEMAATTDSGEHNLEYGEGQRMAFIGYLSISIFLILETGMSIPISISTTQLTIVGWTRQ